MTVELRRDGEIEIVTLNRPEALNALSFRSGRLCLVHWNCRFLNLHESGDCR